MAKIPSENKHALRRDSPKRLLIPWQRRAPRACVRAVCGAQLDVFKTRISHPGSSACDSDCRLHLVSHFSLSLPVHLVLEDLVSLFQTINFFVSISNVIKPLQRTLVYGHVTLLRCAILLEDYEQPCGEVHAPKPPPCCNIHIKEVLCLGSQGWSRFILVKISPH